MSLTRKALSRPLVTQERLRELLYYNPDTGRFYWKVKRPGGPSANDYAGSDFGKNIGLKISIDGRPYRAARLAWFYIYGTWPEEIDHINCDPFDDRLVNLREANRQQNNWNRRKNKNNKTGFKGVNRYMIDGVWTGKYRVRMFINGKLLHLGLFGTKEDAAAAYVEAARKHHGVFARVE